MNSARLGNAVRIVIALDKFKGSLSAGEGARCLSTGIREARADAEAAVVPMADGGEGTLDAARPAWRTVAGVLRDEGRRSRRRARRRLGLALVPAGRRDALAASSRGTGELITAALDAGATRIVLAIGGSASTDGGAGLIAALGAQPLNASGAELAEGGEPCARSRRWILGARSARGTDSLRPGLRRRPRAPGPGGRSERVRPAEGRRRRADRRARGPA